MGKHSGERQWGKTKWVVLLIFTVGFHGACDATLLSTYYFIGILFLDITILCTLYFVFCILYLLVRNVCSEDFFLCNPEPDELKLFSNDVIIK